MLTLVAGMQENRALYHKKYSRKQECIVSAFGMRFEMFQHYSEEQKHSTNYLAAHNREGFVVLTGIYSHLHLHRPCSDCFLLKNSSSSLSSHHYVCGVGGRHKGFKAP